MIDMKKYNQFQNNSNGLLKKLDEDFELFQTICFNRALQKYLHKKKWGLKDFVNLPQPLRLEVLNKIEEYIKPLITKKAHSYKRGTHHGISNK